MKVKLVIVRGQPHGKSLLFPKGEFVIGRGSECHVRPNSSWVSRQHCLLRVTEDELWLRDLGSTNGTLVNGARLIGERHLTQGDEIQIGPLVFGVRIDEQPPVKAGQADTSVHCLENDTSESQALPVDAPGNTSSPHKPHASAPTIWLPGH